MFMIVKPRQFQFHFCICVKSGEGFFKGDIYPICGSNNGWQMCYTNSQNDVGTKLLHNYGDQLKDAELLGRGEAAFEFFVPKNATISGRCSDFPYRIPINDDWCSFEDDMDIPDECNTDEVVLEHSDSSNDLSDFSENRSWNISI